MQVLLFYLTAVVAIASAIGVIRCRNPLGSAISLLVTFVCSAVFYALLSAPFIAAMQILLYAGVIMALLLFVILQLNLRQATRSNYTHALSGAAILAVLAAMILAGTFLLSGDSAGGLLSAADFNQQTRFVLNKEVLLGDFLLPGIMAALLLLLAVCGAVFVVLQKNSGDKDQIGDAL